MSTSISPMFRIRLDPSNQSTIRYHDQDKPTSTHLPGAKHLHVETQEISGAQYHESATLYFVGTATTILEWAGVRIMTDPNFLHAGDHVHLGPGVTATRLTNPSLELNELPPIDLILLSHYHADHYDQEVEASLRRDLPIITTPHAHAHLSNKPGEGEAMTAVHPLDTWQSMLVDLPRDQSMKVTAMPGKHVPPGPAGLLDKANELLGAVPPTNGWMLELGATSLPNEEGLSTYNIYISGDTLLVSELEDIPKRYPNVNLMLIHLGGTSIPSAKMPLLMVTMDAVQGLKLIQLIQPKKVIPIHYDDYDVFASPLQDFKNEVEKAGLTEKVVYLDRGDAYKFDI